MGNDLSRRGFIRTGLGAAVAAACAPTLLRAQDKAAPATSRPLSVGEGAHTYEVIDDWAKLPEGYKFGNTHGVCETADGRIFIHHQNGSPDSMAIFDPDGKFIKSWGPQFRGGAHGLQLRKEGNDEFLYLAATGQHKVFKTTLDGEVLMELGYPKDAKNAAGEPCYADEKKFVPTNIAFHPTDGSFYVADGYGSYYVHRFSAKGDYLSTFGGKGDAPGELREPHGIYTDTRDSAHPLLAVCDRAHHQLHYFTLDGKPVKVEHHDLRRPCHIDQRGTELLIPDLEGRVTIFDKDNKAIAQLGDNPDVKERANNRVPRDQRTPGQFCSPHGAIWDHAGNIYVAEWLFDGRVTKLRRV
jgi:hypothetical protein